LLQAAGRQHRFVSFVVRASVDIGTAPPESTFSLRCVVCLEGTVGLRNVGLAVLAGLLFLVVEARAQTVELAMAAPEKSAGERCLRSPSASVVIAACSEALEAGLDGPDRARALARRGKARQSLGDGMGAKSDLLQAADQYDALISPLSPPALIYARAVIWHTLGEADRALADYNRVARMQPNDPMVFLNRGLVLARYKADYALALIDFDEVLQLKPGDPEMLHRAALERAAALAITSFASR
jgi:tetratricopeptide (TPR) repeat protein